MSRRYVILNSMLAFFHGQDGEFFCGRRVPGVGYPSNWRARKPRAGMSVWHWRLRICGVLRR